VAISIFVVPSPAAANTINSNVNAHKISAAYFFHLAPHLLGAPAPGVSSPEGEAAWETSLTDV
jgi:hypothetical protein